MQFALRLNSSRTVEWLRRISFVSSMMKSWNSNNFKIRRAGKHSQKATPNPLNWRMWMKSSHSTLDQRVKHLDLLLHHLQRENVPCRFKLITTKMLPVLVNIPNWMRCLSLDRKVKKIKVKPKPHVYCGCKDPGRRELAHPKLSPTKADVPPDPEPNEKEPELCLGLPTHETKSN